MTATGATLGSIQGLAWTNGATGICLYECRHASGLETSTARNVQRDQTTERLSGCKNAGHRFLSKTNSAWDHNLNHCA